MTRVGPWQVAAVESGFFALDGGAMFGVVPRPHWAAKFPPDAEGRIRLAARCLFARHADGRLVVVDAGMGSRWLGRARATYAVEPAAGGDDGLVAALAALDTPPEAVTDVVVTHLHFDHAGGLVQKHAASGKLVPTYGNARVHVQAEQLAWATNPSRRDRGSFRPADFLPLREAGLLVEHHGAGTILPDLEVLLSQGHTPAMQLPLFRTAAGDRRGSVCFPSDLIPTTAHVQLPWVMAFDNQPLVTVEEKLELLGRAADEGWIVVTDHDPDVAAFVVERKPGRGFRIEPVEL